ncbi:MAG: hypothetical protein CVT95_05030 [Bacteroidetes bacterium HGW-Bacteroidetes-12]|nr:MAG: hypothetical protein CVT95_05030 [Bacteroidetes bacterium HGW-Bacteroidetes-12]
MAWCFLCNDIALNKHRLFNFVVHFFRMMIRKFSLLFLPFLALSFIVHNYYVTIIELNYNDENKKIEIALKFIGHDLEYALQKEGVPNLYLGTEKENSNADSLLYAYINNHFSILINDKEQPLSFFGKEVKSNDNIYCYLESTTVQQISSIEVKSDLLIEYFQEHVTIVYITIGEQRFNFRLNKEKIKENHKL